MKAYLDRDKLDHYRKSLRPALGLNALAEAAGLKYSTFYAQYIGRHQATINVVLPLAMLMEISMEEIIVCKWEEHR